MSSAISVEPFLVDSLYSGMELNTHFAIVLMHLRTSQQWNPLYLGQK